VSLYFYSFDVVFTWLRNEYADIAEILNAIANEENQ